MSLFKLVLRDIISQLNVTLWDLIREPRAKSHSDEFITSEFSGKKGKITLLTLKEKKRINVNMDHDIRYHVDDVEQDTLFIVI